MPFVHSWVILPSARNLGVRGQKGGNSNHLSLLIKDYLARGKAVVCAVDERTTNSVVRQLQRASSKVNRMDFPEEHIQVQRLTLLPISHFRMTKFDGELLIQRWREVIEQVGKKNKHRSIVVISNCSLMITKILGSCVRLIEHEMDIAAFSQKQEIVDKMKLSDFLCCYREETIMKMPASHLISVIRCHDAMIDWSNPKELAKWDSEIIYDCISKGINNIMGQNADKLIYRTLKAFYDIDHDKILSDPAQFETKMGKILGDSAMIVLESVEAELRTEIYRLSVLS